MPGLTDLSFDEEGRRGESVTAPHGEVLETVDRSSNSRQPTCPDQSLGAGGEMEEEKLYHSLLGWVQWRKKKGTKTSAQWPSLASKRKRKREMAEEGRA